MVELIIRTFFGLIYDLGGTIVNWSFSQMSWLLLLEDGILKRHEILLRNDYNIAIFFFFVCVTLASASKEAVLCVRRSSVSNLVPSEYARERGNYIGVCCLKCYYQLLKIFQTAVIHFLQLIVFGDVDLKLKVLENYRSGIFNKMRFVTGVDAEDTLLCNF